MISNQNVISIRGCCREGVTLVCCIPSRKGNLAPRGPQDACTQGHLGERPLKNSPVKCALQLSHVCPTMVGLLREHTSSLPGSLRPTYGAHLGATKLCWAPPQGSPLIQSREHKAPSTHVHGAGQNGRSSTGPLPAPWHGGSLLKNINYGVLDGSV